MFCTVYTAHTDHSRGAKEDISGDTRFSGYVFLIGTPRRRGKRKRGNMISENADITGQYLLVQGALQYLHDNRIDKL